MTLFRSPTSLSSARVAQLGAVALALSAFGCHSPRTSDERSQPVVSVSPRSALPNTSAIQTKLAAAAPAVVGAPVAAARSDSSRPIATLALATGATPRHAVESSVQVKRFVVASGVQDREPLPSSDALPADGTAIFAFAELANPNGESENVRITFERKGGRERVGDVTLPIPPSTSRHRTWAFTRYIRTPGVWEAVLWSENGAELSRTSFEVKAS